MSTTAAAAASVSVLAETSALADRFAERVLASVNKSVRPTIAIEVTKSGGTGVHRFCELVLSSNSLMHEPALVAALEHERRKDERDAPWGFSIMTRERRELSSGLIEQTFVVRLYPDWPGPGQQVRAELWRLAKGVALAGVLVWLAYWSQA